MTDLQKLVNAAPWDGDLQSCAMCAEAVATWCVGVEGWCADCVARTAISAVATLEARADKAEAELAKLANPEAVFMNLMFGTMARPSWDQIKHIYAEAREAEAKLAEAVEALEDMLSIAERNEAGGIIDNARAILARIKEG